jgi:NMD protein affecting ribosome stability and mRNA decay
MDEEAAVHKALIAALQFGDAEIDSVEFAEANIERKPGISKTAEVLAVVTGHQDDGSHYEEEYDVRMQYDVTSCPRCAKKGTAYYEGILQIRHQRAAVRETIFAFIKKYASRGLRLAKEVPVSSGSDYYLSNQRLIGQLAKHLHGLYGGELKVSAQHFSYNHAAGKNLYRVNAYLEIPEYSKGDVIRKDNAYYFVLGVSAKVKAENLMNGSRESFPYIQGGATRIATKRTQVTGVNPISILHPTTFQSVTPANSKYAPADLSVEDEVTIAIDGNYVFLIPDATPKEEAKKIRKRHSQKRGTKDDDLINDD